MKKYINFFLSILFGLFLLFSCNNDPVVTEPVPVPTDYYLGVRPTVEGIKSRGIIEDFSSSDRIGLYVTTGNLGNAYEGKSEYNNIPFTYDGSSWNMGKKVEITGNNATVYGYYPYRDNGAENSILPVEIVSQTDYLYSSSAIASKKNPDVSLTMKHGLSLVSFVIERNGYQHTGKLSKIIIDGIKETGELNIGTGKVVGTGADTYYELECDYTIPDNNSKKHSIICLPVNIAETSGVVFKFMIDGYYYTYDVSSSHNWEQGYEYTYTLYLGDYTLPQIPDEDVELDVDYWSKYGKEDNITIGNPISSQLRISTNYTNYGKLAYTGEGKKFGVFVYNYGEDFEGQVRMALFNGNQIIEQYQAYNITIEKGKFDGYCIPCYITSLPGRYKLQPLFREKGQSDWFVPQYSGGVEEEDWIYEIQPITTLPALRSLSLEGKTASDEEVHSVLLNKDFNLDFTISNKANVNLQGEVKVVWERNTKDFGNIYDDHSIFWQDEIGRFDLELNKDKGSLSGQIQCRIINERPDMSYRGPVVHFYFKEKDTDKWILMRDNCDSVFDPLKEVENMRTIYNGQEAVRGVMYVLGQYCTVNYLRLDIK